MTRAIKIGDRYGRLLVTGYGEVRYYFCKCDCGKEKMVRTDHLRNGKIVSCGCYGKEQGLLKSTTHGSSKNPLCFIWHAMKNRCYNEKFQDYMNYGGRGIFVSDQWRSDLNQFISDMQEGYAKGLQLDRINNDLGYSKENCRWVTRTQNNRNKRTSLFLEIDGNKMLAKEWAELSGRPYTTILNRLRKGASAKDAVFSKYITFASK